MRVPWIRVHGALIDRPVVTRLVESCRITPHTAIGVLVTFWSGVAAHATDGRIDGYSDAQLENWARWPGKRGAFAKWVREQHMDPSGRVSEWSEYAGRLEQRRAADRVRKSAAFPQEPERNSSGIPPEPERNSAGVPKEFRTRARERDETVRNERELRRRRQGPETKPADPAPPASAAAEWPEGQQDLLGRLSASRQQGMAACLRLWAHGGDLPPGLGVPTPEQIDSACREVVASVEPGLITAKVVRGYLVRAMRPDTATGGSPAPASGGRSFFDGLRAEIEKGTRS